MKFTRAVLRIMIGIAFGVASALALIPAFAAFTTGPEVTSAGMTWFVILLTAVLVFFAPTIRRAFGRGFLILGAAVFALPLSMMMLSGRVTSDMVAGADAESQTMTALGAGAASLVTTGVAAFVGFFLGSIFLIVGGILAIGGRREIVLSRSDRVSWMYPIAFIVISAFMFGSGDVVAQETREGWGLQFRQDTFDKTLFPLAMLSEDGETFDKALVAFACSADGRLVSFFQPERFMLFAEAAKAQFRGGDETAEFTFVVGEVPNFGKRLIASPEDADRIAAIFAAANGSDISFRTDKKQGVFTSIGAKETFAIMRSYCRE